ncbi:mucin-5AC-like [Dendronephthya gigantea]|uniref:mucin-5AC-like n=1 Tax=Dendronephthya gigantea TaxID=151771 RepID=UPI00106C35DD|nr:mucin-5AC-like [Dendronephthya gigantea]
MSSPQMTSYIEKTSHLSVYTGNLETMNQTGRTSYPNALPTLMFSTTHVAQVYSPTQSQGLAATSYVSEPGSEGNGNGQSSSKNKDDKLSGYSSDIKISNETATPAQSATAVNGGSVVVTKDTTSTAHGLMQTTSNTGQASITSEGVIFVTPSIIAISSSPSFQNTGTSKSPSSFSQGTVDSSSMIIRKDASTTNRVPMTTTSKPLTRNSIMTSSPVMSYTMTSQPEELPTMQSRYVKPSTSLSNVLDTTETLLTSYTLAVDTMTTHTMSYTMTSNNSHSIATTMANMTLSGQTQAGLSTAHAGHIPSSSVLSGECNCTTSYDPQCGNQCCAGGKVTATLICMASSKSVSHTSCNVNYTLSGKSCGDVSECACKGTHLSSFSKIAVTFLALFVWLL